METLRVLRFIPNLLTLLRIAAVAPLVWFLHQHMYHQALVLFALAGLSDGLDGFLARRFGWRSSLGAILDPVADKLLMGFTAVMLVWNALIPLWLLLLIILRDLVISGGAVLYRILRGPFEVQPSMLGKISTFTQLLLVVAVLMNAAYHILPRFAMHALVMLVGVMTLLSGVHYVWIWLRKYRSVKP